MKTCLIPSTVFLATLLMLAPPEQAFAQGPVSQAFGITVAPPHIAAFEEGMREHNKWHERAGDPWAWPTYQAMTGEIGRYVQLTSGHSWADFDNPPVDFAGDFANALETIAPHALDTRATFGELLVDLSMPPPADAPIEMATVTEFRVRPGMEEQFLSVIEMYTKALETVGGSATYLWIRNVSGDAGLFTLAIPQASHVSLGAPGDPSALLTAAFGEAQARALGESFFDAVESMEESLFVLRPDLSYFPGM